MLEYRRPGPPPNGKWWAQRHWAIWQRREPDRGPAVAIGPEQVAARNASGTIGVRVFASPGAMYVQLNFTLRRGEPGPAHLEAYEDLEALPDDFVRVGVRFADGRVATNLPGAFWTAPEDGPVFLSVTGSTGDLADEFEVTRRAFALHWVVWPLPPSGPLTVACAWPAHGFAESAVEFDGEAVRAASEVSEREGAKWPVQERERPWWADRGEDDPPIWWSVEAWLQPPPPYESREPWDPVVARIADAAHADRWDGDQLDGWLIEYRQAKQAAGSRTEFGFFAYNRGAYLLEFPVSAPTESSARRRAEDRIDLPSGWRLQLELQPRD